MKWMALTAAMVVAYVVAPETTSPYLRLMLCLLAFACFLNALRVSSRISPRSLFVIGAIVLTSACVASPRGSGDVYMYGMFGSVLSNHHASPYQHAPQEYPNDPLLKATVPEWRHVRAPYGPVFVAIAAVVAKVANGSAATSVHIFQGLCASAMFLTALLLYRRFRDVRLAAFLLLNPALIATVNGGHNDVLIGAALAIAVISVIPDSIRDPSVTAAGPHMDTGFRRYDKQWIGCVIAAIAVSMKLTAIVPVTVLFAAVLFRNKRITPVVTASVLAIAPYLIAGPMHVLSSLKDSGMSTSRASLWSWMHPFASSNVITLCAAIAIVCVVLTRWRNVSAVTTAATYLYPYVLPWYAAPALLVSAAANRERLMRSAMVLSFALTIAYVNPPGEANKGLFALLSAVAIPAALLYELSLYRNQRGVEQQVERPKEKSPWLLRAENSDKA